MTTKTAAITLKGGLDQVSPQLSIDAGRVVDAKNYEALPRGGYRRTDGYVAYSGGWSPPRDKNLSEYHIVVVREQVANFSTGSFDVIGSVSGGVGYCASHRLNDANNIVELDNGDILLAFVMIHNEYQVGDTLAVNGQNWAEVTGLGVPTDDSKSVEVLSKELLALIDKVYNPNALGSGTYNNVTSVGGVKALHIYKGYLYGVRESTDGYDHLYVSDEWLGSNSGVLPGSFTWVETFGNELTKNGNYEFVNYNFEGHTREQIMFGVNGVNRAFFVDAKTPDRPALQFVDTGMTHDLPNHIAAFKGHLFLSFPGGSLQHSSINDHTTWSAVTGAAELTTGEEITALKVLPGNALGIFCETKILILYGTSSQDWQLEVYTDSIGALQGTAQNMAAMTLFADERGITQLSAAQEYGDFSSSMLSHDFDTLYRSTIRDFVASTVNKVKSQYRLFTTDGKAVYLTFDRNSLVAAMPIDLNIPVTCATSGEDTEGHERTFFGSADGYVYELDRGYAFDGNSIEHWIRTPFNHFNSPRQKKRFRKLVLDIDSDANVELQVRPEFSYGHKDIADHRVAAIGINEGAQIFENGDDSFSWDYDPVSDGEVFIAGTGTNIGITIYGKSATEFPHTIYGLIYHYTPRALKR